MSVCQVFRRNLSVPVRVLNRGSFKLLRGTRMERDCKGKQKRDGWLASHVCPAAQLRNGKSPYADAAAPPG